MNCLKMQHSAGKKHEINLNILGYSSKRRKYSNRKQHCFYIANHYLSFSRNSLAERTTQESTYCGLEFEAMTTDSRFRNLGEPDKKRQKNMTNAARTIKLSIYKEQVPIHCVFVIEISRNTYSLLTT